MQVRMVRSAETSFIEVKLPNVKNPVILFSDVLDYCAEKLTPKELRMVFVECNKQVLSMDSEDVPFEFREMLKELREIVVNRRVYTEENAKKV